MLAVQNQTDPAVLSQGKPDDLGTGVFAIPDPTSPDYGATTKILVDDITYQECVKRGHATVAFKWVPHKNGAMDSELKDSKCAIAGARCVDRCAPPGCMCVNGVCT
jgi:hypothetical protein